MVPIQRVKKRHSLIIPNDLYDQVVKWITDWKKQLCILHFLFIMFIVNRDLYKCQTTSKAYSYTYYT